MASTSTSGKAVKGGGGSGKANTLGVVKRGGPSFVGGNTPKGGKVQAQNGPIPSHNRKKGKVGSQKSGKFVAS